jgi:tol-pal system protein YbgF
MHRARRLVVLPLVAFATGACFATREDVRILQGDIAVLRAESARADSMHRAQMRQVAQQVGAVSDTLRTVNAFLARFQGDFTLTMHTFGQQLLTVQELTGQSQKKLQEMRADLEAREAERAAAASQPVTPPPVAAPVAGAANAPAAPAVKPSVPTQPGPNQLFQLAVQQLQGGRTSAARDGFADFLQQYPNSDLAPEAVLKIGQAWELDGKMATADSAYQLVTDRFPKSDQAPTAIYKRAMIFRQAGQTRQARALFQQLIDKYPKSPLVELAQDFLKTLK